MDPEAEAKAVADEEEDIASLEAAAALIDDEPIDDEPDDDSLDDDDE